MERLSRARDLSRKMDSHHSVGSDVDRRGHATDENIHQAMQQLHTPNGFQRKPQVNLNPKWQPVHECVLNIGMRRGMNGDDSIG